MANTYTQLYIHVVFAVQGSESLIPEQHREAIEKYICGIVTGLQSKPIAIYCNPDHTHLLIGLDPLVSIADMLRDIKSCSSKWINNNRLLQHHFEWQRGYGAFSYSRSQLDGVVKYVLNQHEHHRKKTFKEEYLSFLEAFGIDYDKRYLFKFE